MDIAPNQTLYVSNLPEKIKKQGEHHAAGSALDRVWFAAACSWGRPGCSPAAQQSMPGRCEAGPGGFPWRRYRPPAAACAPPPGPLPLPAELKQLLYALFGQFGKIVDLVTMRTDRLRGQVRLTQPHRAAVPFALQLFSSHPRLPFAAHALCCTRLCAPLQLGPHFSPLQAWVVFADIGAATNALRGMQAFPFFDKPMVSCRASPRACLPLKQQEEAWLQHHAWDTWTASATLVAASKLLPCLAVGSSCLQCI